MGIKERHERERESVRRAILDAARDLFVREGYQHVSIRKIAERIEYSPAAIYSYFASKDDIFFALAEDGFQLLHGMAQATRPPDGASAIDTLRAMLMSMFRFSQRHPEHYNLMFVDRSVPRIRANYERFQFLIDMKRRMSTTVERCIAEGALPAGLDGHSTFRVLAASVHGAAALAISERLGPGESGEALAHDALSIALRGLATGYPLTFRACSPPDCPVGAPAAPVGAGTTRASVDA
ncbi:MAG: TetR/AcrR family transcriptional regulator [Acidobacteria bacterium]|nr:TetR/AcrR family transcriptional regulator [Acidobacteriota bacterium]